MSLATRLKGRGDNGFWQLPMERLLANRCILCRVRKARLARLFRTDF